MDSSVPFEGFAGKQQAYIAVQVDLSRFGSLKSERVEDELCQQTEKPIIDKMEDMWNLSHLRCNR